MNVVKKIVVNKAEQKFCEALMDIRSNYGDIDFYDLIDVIASGIDSYEEYDIEYVDNPNPVDEFFNSLGM